MSKTEQERKDVWEIEVKAEQTLTVSFEEELTAKEALVAFNAQDYYDIIDVEEEGVESVGIR